MSRSLDLRFDTWLVLLCLSSLAWERCAVQGSAVQVRGFSLYSLPRGIMYNYGVGAETNGED